MNYKMVLNTLGNILKVEAAMLLLPLIVSLINSESCWWAFLTTSAICAVIGFGLTLFIKPENKNIFAKDGLAVTGLSWIVLSLLGCLPFVFSKEIPNFIDAFFETVSGFTTTGATILTNIESLSKGILFWRSFTHWIGGMGVLVFILAILPKSDGQNIFILKAESTGPQVGKLVSKIKSSARILYLIYIALTIIETVFLLIGGMPLFDSIVNSLATAGTGGFSIYNDSIAHYNTYSQIVIGVFMLLFGINFNMFYLLLIGKFKQVFKSEELWIYISIIVASITAITLNLFYSANIAFGTALKDSFFQVSAIITTTGFVTADFNTWPMLSKTILILLMFVGGCAGSTAGGLKVSRIAILFKSVKKEIKRLVHPNSVSNIHFEGTTIDSRIVHGVCNYFGLFMLILAGCFVVVSFDPSVNFETSLTSVITCINNVGPGLGLVGPTGNFSFFTVASKIVLIFAMLVGRLEIYPMIIIFFPSVWKINKNNSI